MFSLNRETDPVLVFDRGEGAHIWDADGNRYLDYHVAFGPYLLGHNAAAVNEAVLQSFQDKSSLFGANTTRQEGRLAEAPAHRDRCWLSPEEKRSKRQVEGQIGLEAPRP